MMNLPEGSLSLQIIIDSCSSSVKALDAYYKEKALVGAFSEHCQENYREISLTALHNTVWSSLEQDVTCSSSNYLFWILNFVHFHGKNIFNTSLKFQIISIFKYL